RGAHESVIKPRVRNRRRILASDHVKKEIQRRNNQHAPDRRHPEHYLCKFHSGKNVAQHVSRSVLSGSRIPLRCCSHMATTLLHVARALTPVTEIPDAAILIRDGVIESIGPRSEMSVPAGANEVSGTEYTAIPGFIDVHIHGAGGRDVMEATDDAMIGVAKTIARHGTTSFVAT